MHLSLRNSKLPANCPVQPPPCHAAPLPRLISRALNVTCLEESGYASELLVTPHAHDCLRPSLHSESEWIILALVAPRRLGRQQILMLASSFVEGSEGNHPGPLQCGRAVWRRTPLSLRNQNIITALGNVTAHPDEGAGHADHPSGAEKEYRS